jgi:hypothetical protein
MPDGDAMLQFCDVAVQFNAAIPGTVQGILANGDRASTVGFMG